MTNTAMAKSADLVDPSTYEVGMDYEAIQAEFVPYYEGIPGFGVDNSLGGDGGISSNINFNSAFHPGTTRVKIAFKFLPDPAVLLTPQVRVRFHYWPETLWVTAFDQTPYGYATDVTFRLMYREDGSEYVEVIEDIQGMELMQASSMRLVTGPLKPREWNEVEIDLMMGFTFPARAWTSGVQLEANEVTRREVEQEYRKLYEAYQNGYDSTFKLYARQMKNSGQTYGMSADNWFKQSSISQLAAGEFELLPFDSSESELRIFGNERVATLHPSPIKAQTNFDEIFQPIVFFWKDSQGRWSLQD